MNSYPDRRERIEVLRQPWLRSLWSMKLAIDASLELKLKHSTCLLSLEKINTYFFTNVFKRRGNDTIQQKWRIFFSGWHFTWERSFNAELRMKWSWWTSICLPSFLSSMFDNHFILVIISISLYSGFPFAQVCWNHVATSCFDLRSSHFGRVTIRRKAGNTNLP